MFQLELEQLTKQGGVVWRRPLGRQDQRPLAAYLPRTSGTTLSGEVGPGLRRLHRAPRYCLHTVEAATHSLRDSARKGQGSIAWVAARGESGETCARGRKRASDVWESDENCLANEARLKLQIISHFNFFLI